MRKKRKKKQFLHINMSAVEAKWRIKNRSDETQTKKRSSGFWNKFLIPMRPLSRCLRSKPWLESISWRNKCLKFCVNHPHHVILTTHSPIIIWQIHCMHFCNIIMIKTFIWTFIHMLPASKKSVCVFVNNVGISWSD